MKISAISLLILYAIHKIKALRPTIPLIGPIPQAPPLMIGGELTLSPPTPLQWRSLSESAIMQMKHRGKESKSTIEEAPIIAIIDEYSAKANGPRGRYATLAAVVGVSSSSNDIDLTELVKNPNASRVRLLGIGRALVKDLFYKVPSKVPSTEDDNDDNYNDGDDINHDIRSDVDDDDDDEDEDVDDFPIVMANFEPFFDTTGDKSSSSPIHTINKLHKVLQQIESIHEDRKRLVKGLKAALARLDTVQTMNDALLSADVVDYDGLGFLGDNFFNVNNSNNNNNDDDVDFNSKQNNKRDNNNGRDNNKDVAAVLSTLIDEQIDIETQLEALNFTEASYDEHGLLRETILDEDKTTTTTKTTAHGEKKSVVGDVSSASAMTTNNDKNDDKATLNEFLNTYEGHADCPIQDYDQQNPNNDDNNDNNDCSNEIEEYLLQLENFGVNYYSAFSTISELTKEATKRLKPYYSETYRSREEYQYEVAGFVAWRCLSGYCQPDNTAWALACTSSQERLDWACSMMYYHRELLNKMANDVSDRLRDCGEECTDLW